MTSHILSTQLGRLVAIVENETLLALTWDGKAETYAQASPVVRHLQQELDLYFAGTLRVFTTPMLPMGTPFQMSVWEALTTIAYGTTRSYAQQAAAMGQPLAIRAIATANGQNPIQILVPCHRVIGTNGSLTGYAGGLARKQALLDLEQGQGQLF